MDCNEINIMQVAQEIQQYLCDHPCAADTLEGITHWWLVQQKVEISQSLVQQALDKLVAFSIVKVKKNRGGDAIYSSAEIEPKDY